MFHSSVTMVLHSWETAGPPRSYSSYESCRSSRGASPTVQALFISSCMLSANMSLAKAYHMAKLIINAARKYLVSVVEGSGKWQGVWIQR